MVLSFYRKVTVVWVTLRSDYYENLCNQMFIQKYILLGNIKMIDLHLLKMCVQYELLVVSGKLLVIYVHNLCYYHP